MSSSSFTFVVRGLALKLPSICSATWPSRAGPSKHMVQRWNGSTQRNCSDPAPMMLGLPSLSMGDGADRKRVVWGKRVSVRVDIGGRRSMKKKKQDNDKDSRNK